MNPPPNADTSFLPAFELRKGQAEEVETWVSSRRVEMSIKGICELRRLSFFRGKPRWCCSFKGL